jgi:MFS family permease
MITPHVPACLYVFGKLDPGRLGMTAEPLERAPDWTDEERPSMPGSAPSIAHAPPLRLAYAGVGVLLALTGGLGNALVGANLPNIQGHLGLTPTEGAWIPAAYLMVNVSSNLVLFKVRQQYGLRRFAEVGLLASALVSFLHLFVESFGMAVFVRAASGLAAAPLSAMATMYILQAFPKAMLGQGLVVALGLSTLATPLAWLMSPALLDLGEWRGLYLFESGLAIISWAAVVALKLPRSVRVRVIEPLDYVTFALLGPALALIGAVFAQVRTQWPPDHPWMAAALAAALLLTLAAFALEHHRANPLLQTRWLGSLGALRFALGALGLRFLLSEQTYSATGLLRTLGMGPDQLQPLYAVMLVGILIGIAVSALTFNQKTVVPQILLSVVLIAVGSFLDYGATSLTRPQNMFVSQFLLSVAGAMFMGPLLLVGIMPVLKRGPEYIVSFVVLFAIAQSFGGLAGPAILGTVQQFREHEYSAIINAGVDPTDGVVQQRLQLQGQVYGRVVTDPVLRQAQGIGQLAQAATREANVRAYNDVFLLNGLLALLFLGWSLAHVMRLAIAARKNPPPSAPAATASM